MIYFDSDVLVHYFFLQDPVKQAQARSHLQRAARQNDITISVLSLQEVSFVMHKLKAALTDINQALILLKQFPILPITFIDFQRAEIFAQTIGYQSINDCIHTAIAEQHCRELVTFNRNDFSRLQPLTGLKITIL